MCVCGVTLEGTRRQGPQSFRHIFMFWPWAGVRMLEPPGVSSLEGTPVGLRRGSGGPGLTPNLRSMLPPYTATHPEPPCS